MMKVKIFSLLLLTFIGVNGLLAEDEEQRWPVGEREKPLEEFIAVQEKRACDDEQKAEESAIEASSVMAKGWWDNYNGDDHWVVGVSLSGDTVELNDGSIWHIYSGHSKKTLSWLTSDKIVIEANSNRLSYFQYKLTNESLGHSVKARMVKGPFYSGPFTLWIEAISDKHVWLSDGSVWNLSIFDDDVYYGWIANDTIIVGINNDWLSGFNPYILINVNTNDYARGSLK
ncbi:MAG: hypothetical protein ACQEP8_04355 [Chlamydiota bacterium]